MQGKQTWSDCSGLPGMRHVRFKGGTTTKRVIPKQTEQEKNLQTGLFNYGMSGLNNAANYQTQANAALGNTIDLNWDNLYGGYTDTMNGVNSGYAGLLSGSLPSSFSTARQTALNNDLQGTVGNAVNNLMARGVLGDSSSTRSMFNDISQNAANTLANNYTTDLNSYQNILGNTASNAANQLTSAAQAQQNSYYAPSQLSSLANNSLSAGQNLFNTLYSGRMGTAGTSTSGSSSDGIWNAVGSIGSAALMCFVAGTKISTPGGEKNIEEIQVGDKVISLNGSVESVIELQEPFVSPNEYMLIETKTTQIRPTSTQHFMTTEGYLLPHQLQGKMLVGLNKTEEVIAVTDGQEKELVYDFKCTGANVYFANGFAVKGRD